ncbi:MAG: peptidoglycan bridge formation glycyltransferase FemA/FemB family protein [Anaerolineales bacterium]|nr:peptidoglycan bridge formation glycyltransferase FemA/FemB family protein [Anaerolineales bacterium]
MISSSAAGPAEWKSAIERLPDAHVLQTWEWGECKARYGWTVERRIWRRGGAALAAAQILRRSVRFGPLSACLFYVPKGPLLDWRDSETREAVLTDLEDLGKKERAVQVKIDPDLPLGEGLPGPYADSPDAIGAEAARRLTGRGWRFSAEQIQFRNTVVLDLRQGEADLLAAMKPKTRYNIRLAQRHGVTVRAGTESDLPLLYRMYAETADRDSFVIRSQEYYLDVWGAMLRAGLAQPLIAEINDLAVAALILFQFASRGWYLFGMSRALHREKMPNHLLQWEAARWLKGQGCTHYDLWGAPDVFCDSDPLWGVFQFKLGFGGAVTRHIGAWDFAPSPLRYAAYHQILPRVLDVTRALARRRIRRQADSMKGTP